MPRRRPRHLILGLFTLALTASVAFGVAAGLASGRPAAAPASAASAHRPQAAAETLPQCLAKLRRLVAATAKLDRLADRVKEGKVYLLRTDRVFQPVSKETFEAFGRALVASGGGTETQLENSRRDLQEDTAANLKQLLFVLDDAHSRIRAIDERCEALKNGGGGPTPTGAAVGLTISLGGATQTTDLKTGAATPPPHSPGATAHLQSGQTYSGTVKVTGTLPAGYTAYVAFHGRVWVDLGPDGGGFSGITETKGFGAANDVGAHACKPPGAEKGDPLPSSCFGQGGATIDIVWSP